MCSRTIVFTIQNVPIKFEGGYTNDKNDKGFTIQNVPIKSFVGFVLKKAIQNLQYKMFLLNRSKLFDTHSY